MLNFKVMAENAILAYRRQRPLLARKPLACLLFVQESCTNHTCALPQLSDSAFCGTELLNYPARLSSGGQLPLGQVKQTACLRAARSHVLAAFQSAWQCLLF